MLQKSPSAEIEQELRGWVDQVWDVHRDRILLRSSRRKGIDIWNDNDCVYHDALVESVKRLEEKFKSEELKAGVADLYFNPMNWLIIDQQHPFWAPDVNESQMFYVFETSLHLHPPDDLVERFMNRANTILQHPLHGGERTAAVWPPNNHYPPDLEDLDRLLKYIGPDIGMVDCVARFLRGEFDVDVDVSVREGEPRYKKAYDAYSHKLPLMRFKEYLDLHSELPYELFCEALRKNGRLIRSASSSAAGWRRDRETRPEDPARGYDYADSFLELLEVYVARFADEMAEDITEENSSYLKEMGHLSGSRWLIKAAEVHRDFGLKKVAAKARFKTYSAHRSSMESLVVHLANAKAVVPEEPAEYKRLVEELKGFAPETLRYLLPIAKRARGPILEALEWQDAEPLVGYVLELGVRAFGNPYGPRDMPNSPDPSSGAVDLKRYREA